METIINFIGNLTHSAGPAVGRPFILRDTARMIVQAAETSLIGIEQATEALTRMSGQAAGPSALQ